MEAEGGGAGGFFKQKFMGIPAWVFLAGAAVVAYLYFSHKNAASTPTNRTSGGGGTVKTGRTTVQSGAVRINVNGATGGDEEPQPKPPHHGHHHHKPGDPDNHTRAITVSRSMTLEELAQERNWTPETISDVESMNLIHGKPITPETRLHKGQTIIRPLDSPV